MRMMVNKDTNMSDGPLLIEPSTRVAALLDHYPQLEDVLIAMAPPFKKLKNPILRKGVAKVASLRQAAAVARVPVEELVNSLRSAVGQSPIAPEDVGEAVCYFTDKPDWFDPAKIVTTIDEREDVDDDKMPLAAVLRAAIATQPSQIVELITNFLPAPGIDIMKGNGYKVWSCQETPERVRTYFSKPN